MLTFTEPFVKQNVALVCIELYLLFSKEERPYVPSSLRNTTSVKLIMTLAFLRFQVHATL